MFRYISILLIALTLFLESEASLWDKLRERGLVPGKEYLISSGTGFYINDNYIVTNDHVVQNCLNISIRGGVPDSPAYLYASDSVNDLALISTETKPKVTAVLRANPQDLIIGEEAMVIGYPLNSSESGQYTYSQALIESLKKESNKLTEVEFDASIEHGNSGGPLIDLSGNIVGVVQARKSYYIDQSQLSNYQSNNIESDKPFKVSGVAIGLSRLEEFLTKNKINYKTERSNDLVKYYNAQKIAQNYVVNIHCVKK